MAGIFKKSSSHIAYFVTNNEEFHQTLVFTAISNGDTNLCIIDEHSKSTTKEISTEKRKYFTRISLFAYISDKRTMQTWI